jgi:hypothetical protein
MNHKRAARSRKKGRIIGMETATNCEDNGPHRSDKQDVNYPILEKGVTH